MPIKFINLIRELITQAKLDCTGYGGFFEAIPDYTVGYSSIHAEAIESLEDFCKRAEIHASFNIINLGALLSLLSTYDSLPSILKRLKKCLFEELNLVAFYEAYLENPHSLETLSKLLISLDTHIESLRDELYRNSRDLAKYTPTLAQKICCSLLLTLFEKDATSNKITYSDMSIEAHSDAVFILDNIGRCIRQLHRTCNYNANNLSQALNSPSLGKPYISELKKYSNILSDKSLFDELKALYMNAEFTSALYRFEYIFDTADNLVSYVTKGKNSVREFAHNMLAVHGMVRENFHALGCSNQTSFPEFMQALLSNETFLSCLALEDVSPQPETTTTSSNK